MDVLIKEEFDIRRDDVLYRLDGGAVFIHPTDTIYGIGCNAMDEGAVKRIRRIKGRPKEPFSVIAPSKEWIKKHMVLTPDGEKWLGKLPGPYTLILKAKERFLPDAVSPGIDTLGVRMPAHWISGFVHEFGFPVITTSANKVGGNFMTSLDDIDEEIRQGVDFAIFEGRKRGRPSKIVNLTKGVTVLRR